MNCPPEPFLPEAAPESAGMDAGQLGRGLGLLQEAVDTKEIPAAGLAVARRGRLVVNAAVGLAAPDGPAATPETIWLIASVTKPVVCGALCLLLERGLLGLDDPVARFVPEFAVAGKEAVTLRHVLTHTSGLPDMLPDNIELRRAHTPLAGFVERVCALPIEFPAGTRIRYQSMGIAMIAEVVERLTGERCGEFLSSEFFEPLGMEGASLGWRDGFAERVAMVRLSETQANEDWNWNSAYWRCFGAPWGGMFARPVDLVRYLQVLLGGGPGPRGRPFSAATVRAMIADQTTGLPTLSEEERRREAWGLGWRVNTVPHSDYLGDLLSPRAFGHGGATGTAAWADPEMELAAAVFTSQPGSGRLLGRVANAIAAAVIPG